jgi:uncharacterized protein (TIGR03118 family)
VETTLQLEAPVLRYTSSVRRSSAIVAVLAAALVACSSDDEPTTPILPGGYNEVKLVADDASLGATTVDANLVNPWGLAFSAGGTLWVSNNATHTSTLYNGAGVKQALVVAIPKSGATTGGSPTGQVFNPTTDFAINGGNKASFIFSNEDGTIAAWNSGASAIVVADRSTNGAVYKGLALAANAGANFLYAANFKARQVDVFDRTFKYVSSFTDASIPAGYAPFGIHTINGQLWVTFAKQKGPDNVDDQPGVGNGYVVIFNTDGTVVKRFASNGKLNSPWAVVLAPAGWGSAAGNILIGNFGDGVIGAYDATTGAFRGFLNDANKVPLSIPGLWDLKYGVGSAPATSLYFTAGPSGETHGLLGTITVIP